MKLCYTLSASLVYIKRRILELEKQMEIEENPWKKQDLEAEIQHQFTSGLNVLSFTKPGEASPELIDWFIGRKPQNPDLKRSYDREKWELL